MLSLTDSEKQALLRLARGTLDGYFQRNAPDPLDSFQEKTQTTSAAHPCFVSLYGPEDRLRGCIGCVSTTDPLYANVSRYAELAAFSDHRFPAVKANEIPKLHIHISVLGPLLPLQALRDLVIGTHGLWVEHELTHGILLAEVAVKNGFDPDEFRTQTCLKAGLDPEHHAEYEWKYFHEISFREE